MPNVCCCLMKRKHSDRTTKENEDEEQEVLLGLSQVSTLEDVSDAVRSIVSRVFPDGHSVHVEVGGPARLSLQSNRSNGCARKRNFPKDTIILNRQEMQQEMYSDIFNQDNLDNFGVFLPLKDEAHTTANTASSGLTINPGYLLFQSHEMRAQDKKLVVSIENQITLMFKRLQRNSRPEIKQPILPPAAVAEKSTGSGSRNNTDDATTGIISSSAQLLPANNGFPEAELGQKILCLCAELHDRDPGVMQVKIIKFLKVNIRLESAFILTITPNPLELVCQARDDRIFNPEKRIRITDSIFEAIISNKKCVQLKDIAKIDALFDMESLTDTKWNSFLCIPILSQNDNTVTALACLVNKIGTDNFTPEDVEITQHLFRYIGAVLTSTVAFQMERRLKVQKETMLEVAMNIFRKLDDLTVLLKEIMNEAKKLTDAERCSVFLVEKEADELVAKVFDGLPTVSDHFQSAREIRIPLTQGVAGHVASTGKMLNIADAYSHPLFYRRVDDETGYKTRNILCFPIKDETEEVVGVAQLCNKINGPYFTTYDEDVAITFSVYCGISIMHSLMYKKVQDSQHRNKLANELMTYHMQVNEENVSWLTRCEMPELKKIKENIHIFQCLPREIEEADSLLTVLGMFNELGFISRWRIGRPTLARFILMVKKGYRDPPYHNWTHAFTVAHFVYLCLHNLPLDCQLQPLEQLALFVASLCHDIDHRGTNNTFQVASNSVLAALYSSEGSVLERHHFSQTVCILNSEGCNIFDNLSRQDYQQLLDLIRDIILATDLAQHLRIIEDQRIMIRAPYDPQNIHHRNLLLALLMTCADLSDQSKTWKNTRAVAQLIYEEFFTQGDLEKSIGQKPAEQMDRERACVPSLQISFLDGIAMPCFRIFADMYPQHGTVMTENIRKNRSIWERLNEDINNGKISANVFQLFHKDISPSGSLTSL